MSRAKGKGSYQFALDWNPYLHHGLWVSRRGEDTDEEGPSTPAGAGMAYYRVDAGNCYSLPFALPKLDEIQGQVINHAGRGLAGATVYLVSSQSLQLVNGRPRGGHWSNGRLEPVRRIRRRKGRHEQGRAVHVDCGRVGLRGFNSFLDRCKLKIAAGKAARLDYVRTKGGPISGQVVGRKESGIEGAMVKVVVPENGEVKPVRIEVPPPSDAKPSAPAKAAEKPASQPPNKPASLPATTV
jgi:hypothetical protein